MRDRLVLSLVATIVGTSFPVRAVGAEVVAKAGEWTVVGDGIALLCSRKDDRNFKGYPLRKGTTPHVVSLSWQSIRGESVLIRFSEDESSRMLLLAAGASYPPSAMGSDNPPPPLPGRARAPTDYWSKVTVAMLFKEGGRFMGMPPDFPRDFLFELPATSGPPEALHLQARIFGGGEKEYTVRCDLGK